MFWCGDGGQPCAGRHETRGAQHEGVPEQSRSVQEPSHGAQDDGDGSLSQPHHVGRLIKFKFQFALIFSHTMLVD